MTRINQDLIGRLADELQIGRSTVYRHIQSVVNESGLENDLAALVLARRLGINVKRYSTPEQRETLRRAQSASAFTDNGPKVVVKDVPRVDRKRKSKRERKVRGTSVFVVHGRDEELRKSMFAYLRALGLNPLEWSHAVKTAQGANPYIGEILDSAMQKVQAVVVLFSPDDLAQLKEQFCGRGEKSTEGKLKGQPRPNVLFEAGLALGAHPDKTLLVQVGQVRGFSDIAGRHLVRLSDDFEKRNEVANRLEQIGCAVNRVGNDWATVGTFRPSEPKGASKNRR